MPVLSSCDLMNIFYMSRKIGHRIIFGATKGTPMDTTIQFGLGQNFFGLAHFLQGLIFVIEHQMKFEPIKIVKFELNNFKQFQISLKQFGQI